MIGNFQYAAEVALKCGRCAEAILIAEAGGDQVFSDIIKKYYKLNKDPFIAQVLQPI